MDPIAYIADNVGASVSDDASHEPDTSSTLVPKGQRPRFDLDHARPLLPTCFPHLPSSEKHPPPSTIANVAFLLDEHGIVPRYNVIKKKMLITMPGYSGCSDNYDNVAMTNILSLATLNRMNIGQVPAIVEAIADRQQFNPVAEWIKTRPWDGIDRLPAFYATLVEREDFPRELKEKLTYRWLVSAVAAALMPSGFSCRGVLTLQGPQGIGKTKWTNALVSDAHLAKEVIKVDHLLDPGDKDSRLSALTHWIVEFGELDGTLKRDMALVKGFLTADQDKIRRPYARMDSQYQRRTVFCATVNDAKFLVDRTGNTRWWTISVIKINYTHGIDMQQVFAQVALDFEAGAQWWLPPDEEQQLNAQNKEHESVSSLRECLLDWLDLDRIGEPNLKAMTPTELLKALEIDKPTNHQAKECGQILRDLLGDSKRIQGRDRWRIPERVGRDPEGDPFS